MKPENAIELPTPMVPEVSVATWYLDELQDENARVRKFLHAKIMEGTLTAEEIREVLYP